MKSTAKVFLFTSFLLLAQVALAQNYYVSNSGDDNSNDGMSEANPWKTIEKVNALTPSPGDSILFKRGDTWRILAYKGVQVKASGSPDSSTTGQSFDPDKESYENYITYGAYGNGVNPKPRILGSTKVEGWTNVNGNIWKAPLSYNPIARKGTYGGELYFELDANNFGFGVHRDYDASLSKLTKEYDSVWNDGTIYLYSEGDPDTKYDAIEAPYTPTLIFTNNKDYLAFDNLEIAYGLEMGIGDAGNPGTHYGLKVTNNHIHHIGKKGSSKAYGLSLKRSHMLIEKNDIHDCGRRNISLNLYGTDKNHILMEYVTVRNNYLHEGWHTTGIDTINSGRDTSTSDYHTQRYIYIYNNLLEDDKYNELDEGAKYSSELEREHDQGSNFMYVTSDPGNTSEYIYIYNNIFKNAKGKGVALDGVDNVYIFNNTFYGIAHNILFNTSLNSISVSDTISGDGVYRFHIGNNIFYNDSLEYRPQYTTPLFIKTGMVKNAEFIDYNLYYATPTSRKRLINVYSKAPSSYGDVNVVFSMDNFSQWPLFNDYSGSGFDIHSPAPSNPLFGNPGKNDFRVGEGSPAIGAGKPIAWIITDYYGNPRDPKHPTLGAIEDKFTVVPPSSNSAFWNLILPSILNASGTQDSK